MNLVARWMLKLKMVRVRRLLNWPTERGGAYVPEFVYFDETGYTEIALRDVPMVWCIHSSNVECAYDFDGRLVGMRVTGDVTSRPKV